jgi:hypothetical protein
MSWIQEQIEQLEHGIELMESGRNSAPCDIRPDLPWREREAAEKTATVAKIAQDRKTIAGLKAIIADA